MTLTTCGGGGSTQSPNAMGPETSSSQSTTPETGPLTKTVPVPGSTTAVISLFPDGRAFFSADGYNLDGSGSTILAYSGSLQVTDVVPVDTGVVALLSDGSAYFSPDGRNLGGGGASVRAYAGTNKIGSLIKVGHGIDVVFPAASGAEVYYSGDGLNLGGGGQTSRIYNGAANVQTIVAVGPEDAVVTLFDNGSAFYSVDNRNLGGGGNTVPAAGSAPITSLVAVGGGVLARFPNGNVYLSADGKNLSGGGSTVRVAAWDTSIANGPFSPRDSAHGATFLGTLWLSGGFADATGADSCFTTCSFYDLWSSADASGVSWNSVPNFATASPPNPRDAYPIVNNGVQDSPLPADFYDSYSALVVWSGELTAIGSTVWRSPDGSTWTRQNLADGSASPGPLPSGHATENSRALVLGATLYFIQPEIGEVYSTTAANATGWTDLGSITGFAPRCGGVAFVQQGQMWLGGGGACDYSKVYHDLWTSSDGVHWTQQPVPAAWSGRMWPCIAIADGVTWLAGGYAPTDWNSSGGIISARYALNHADVWYSKNGMDWRQYKADVGSKLPDDGGLEPRHAPTCYVVGDTASARSLLIAAGTGGTDPNAANAETLNSIRRLALPEAGLLP